MPRSGGGIYSKPAGTTAVPNTTIESSKYNSTIDDIVTDLNAARPISAGGTGSTTAADARTALGISATNTPFTPTGAIAATNVQTALAELDSEKATASLYAPLAGASFTGGIAGTTAAFTGIVEGAAATSGGHLLNRTTADARYDRILTSPTALTNGATIPNTENGRFYSMALPTVQTATLPSTSGLPDGFSVIVRATGLPAGYQTSSIAGNGKNIQYRNSAVATFFLIGNGEIFRFTWLSGLDVWLAECLQHPGLIEMSRGHNGTTWNSGTTSATGVTFNTVGGSSSLFNVSSSITTLAPVAGVYSYEHRVHMSANAGGATPGVGYILGIDKVTGAPNSTQGYTFTGMDNGSLSDNYMHISNTQPLQPGQQMGAAYLMSVTTLWFFPGNNAQSITLVSR